MSLILVWEAMRKRGREGEKIVPKYRQIRRRYVPREGGGDWGSNWMKREEYYVAALFPFAAHHGYAMSMGCCNRAKPFYRIIRDESWQGISRSIFSYHTKSQDEYGIGLHVNISHTKSRGCRSQFSHTKSAKVRKPWPGLAKSGIRERRQR